MTPAELRSAIEGPAAAVGVRLAEGLAERILTDIRAEPGQLPLLEFALTLLWQQQEHRELTHAGYEGIGGVEQALARHADMVYEQLDLSAQADARRVFLQLVRPG